MTMPADLAALGEALERATHDDLRRARRSRFYLSRRLAVVLVVLAVGIPAAAVGASRLVGGAEVAQSMPAGAAIFEGLHPTCTTVVENVEYHCVLDRSPVPEVQDFTSVKEATVDATKHVNGGCIGLSADGLRWQCYLGEAAVRHAIVSRDFLGEYAPSPGHG